MKSLQAETECRIVCSSSEQKPWDKHLHVTPRPVNNKSKQQQEANINLIIQKILFLQLVYLNSFIVCFAGLQSYSLFMSQTNTYCSPDLQEKDLCSSCLLGGDRCGLVGRITCLKLCRWLIGHIVPMGRNKIKILAHCNPVLMDLSLILREEWDT